MDCDFSDPRIYDGNVPANSFDVWNYTHMSCSITSLPTATPSAQTQTFASTSAYIDIASSSAIAQGLYHTIFLLWITCVLLLLIGGFFMGTYIFRK